MADETETEATLIVEPLVGETSGGITSEDAPGAIEISEPAAQGVIDKNICAEAIGATRREIAARKIEYRMALQGLLREQGGKGVHPNQVKEQWEDADKRLVLLLELYDMCKDGDDIPQPPRLDVVAK
jgi:hypothetical protein